MDNQPSKEFEQAMEEFEDTEADLDAWIDSKRKYYNKSEADDFRERFSKWQGIRF